MGRRRKRSRSKRQRSSASGASAASRPAKSLPPSWRERLALTLDTLRTYAQQEHAELLAQTAASRLGGPPDQALPADLERAHDDAICLRGTLGPERSIAAAFADANTTLEDLERQQVRRWSAERRRAVLVVQRATRDQLSLWDPLEGAPLTLHLQERLGAGRAAEIERGTVLTVTFQPWMARLVAIGSLELFQGSKPLELFRREVVSSGATWHELPAAPPVRT